MGKLKFLQFEYISLLILRRSEMPLSRLKILFLVLCLKYTKI